MCILKKNQHTRDYSITVYMESINTIYMESIGKPDLHRSAYRIHGTAHYVYVMIPRRQHSIAYGMACVLLTSPMQSTIYQLLLLGKKTILHNQ